MSSPHFQFRIHSRCLKFPHSRLTGVLFLAAVASGVILGLYGQPIQKTAHIFERRFVPFLVSFLHFISLADIIAERWDNLLRVPLVPSTPRVVAEIAMQISV